MSEHRREGGPLKVRREEHPPWGLVITLIMAVVAIVTFAAFAFIPEMPLYLGVVLAGIGLLGSVAIIVVALAWTNGYGPTEGEVFTPSFRSLYGGPIEGPCFRPGEVEITPAAKRAMAELPPLDDGVSHVDFFLYLHLTGEWDHYASDLTALERARNHNVLAAHRRHVGQERDPAQVSGDVFQNRPLVARFGRGTGVIWIVTRPDYSKTVISTESPMDELSTV